MFKMTNEMYDLLKKVALVILPALATFYRALAGIWGLPYAQEIPLTITALDLFLGACLQISSDNYAKGEGESE